MTEDEAKASEAEKAIGGLINFPFRTTDSGWNIGTTWMCGDKLDDENKERYRTKHLIFYRVKPPSLSAPAAGTEE